MATTDGRMYVVGVDSLEKVEIQFFPTSVNITRQGDIQSVEIIGRNNPNYQYTSGETLMRMELDYYAETADRSSVVNSVHWFKSRVYNEGLENPPERVKVVWGDLYKDEVWTIKSVDYKLSDFDKQHGLLPKQAIVNIVLALDPVANRTRKDVQ